VLVTLVLLGGMSIIGFAWARDMSEPRVTLLGADRGVSAFITAGSARVLVLGGTDSAELGNAVAHAQHPGLDRIDLLIVSGNAAAVELAAKMVDLLEPRMVIAVGGPENLEEAGITPARVIDHTTEIELPEGVLLTIEVWPAADGENEDATWSVMIERGGASVYWVADREALMQYPLPEEANVMVLGRGKPASDTPFPSARIIAAAGESVSGPDLREIALNSFGPDAETVRVFAGETKRIELDPEGIGTVSGATRAASPTA
jgi:hypothetical protein